MKAKHTIAASEMAPLQLAEVLGQKAATVLKFVGDQESVAQSADTYALVDDLAAGSYMEQ